MLEDIKKHIIENFLEDKKEKLKFIQISSASEKAFNKGRIIYLFLKENDKVPFIVCKFSKTKNHESSIINEYNVTKKLYETVPQYIAEPFGLVEINDRFVFFQKFEGKLSITNELYKMKNVPYFNEQEFYKYINKSIDIVEELTISFNKVSENSNSNEVEKEIDKQVKEYIINFQLKDFEINPLNTIVKQLTELLSVNGAKRRIVNYDLTPFNIMTDVNNIKVIDLEYGTESTLLIIEPLRYLFSLYRDIYNLDVLKYTNDFMHSFSILLTDIENPIFIRFNRLIRENFGFQLNRKNSRLLCCLILIIEANIQYNVKDYCNSEFIKKYKRYINYFTGTYLASDIFNYEDSLCSELYNYISIKDMQIDMLENEQRRLLKKIEMLNYNIENLKGKEKASRVNIFNRKKS